MAAHAIEKKEKDAAQLSVKWLTLFLNNKPNTCVSAFHLLLLICLYLIFCTETCLLAFFFWRASVKIMEWKEEDQVDERSESQSETGAESDARSDNNDNEHGAGDIEQTQTKRV